MPAAAAPSSTGSTRSRSPERAVGSAAAASKRSKEVEKEKRRSREGCLVSCFSFELPFFFFGYSSSRADFLCCFLFRCVELVRRGVIWCDLAVVLGESVSISKGKEGER